MDGEDEMMDIVAARSRGDNREVELRKLEKFYLEAKQREDDEQSKRFQSSQHRPSTTDDNSAGEETREEEKEDDAFILQVVQEQIKNHRQVDSETPSTEAGLDDELAFPQPLLTRGQHHSDEATMHPGAYAVAPGTDLQRSTTLSRSLWIGGGEPG
ncbi:expressed unknown protein [Seminavis robusta]|uniref:Uncharacterized protein n=1 Tax=Seminavis robusta TaxID=568900 RepID=A0A9N8EE93_9STRA|nr:expressed unknown protein [Seminavis robusta]|eukprot:Sro1025_g232730.1 n/a (156) ;mRNA; f:4537-5120